jgi:hypothetical protein
MVYHESFCEMELEKLYTAIRTGAGFCSRV